MCFKVWRWSWSLLFTDRWSGWYLHHLSMWLMIPHFWQRLSYSPQWRSCPGLSWAVCSWSPRSRSPLGCPKARCSQAWGLPGQQGTLAKSCMARHVYHGLLSSSGCEKGPGAEPPKPGVLSRVNPYSVIDITPLQEDQPPPPDLDAEGEGGGPHVPSGYCVPVPCGYAVPCSLPLLLPAYSSPVLPAPPAEPAGRGPRGCAPASFSQRPTSCVSVPPCRPFMGGRLSAVRLSSGSPGSWNQGVQVGIRENQEGH